MTDREAVRLLRDILHAQNDGEMERAMKAAREWMKTQPVVPPDHDGVEERDR